jgi:hypothetical protein
VDDGSRCIGYANDTSNMSLQLWCFGSFLCADHVPSSIHHHCICWCPGQSTTVPDPKQLLTRPVVSLGLLLGLFSCYCSRLLSMVLVWLGHESECAPRYRSSTSRCCWSQNSRTRICVSSLHVRIVHVRISLLDGLVSAS